MRKIVTPACLLCLPPPTAVQRCLAVLPAWSISCKHHTVAVNTAENTQLVDTALRKSDKRKHAGRHHFKCTDGLLSSRQAAQNACVYIGCVPAAAISCGRERASCEASLVCLVEKHFPRTRLLISACACAVPILQGVWVSSLRADAGPRPGRPRRPRALPLPLPLRPQRLPHLSVCPRGLGLPAPQPVATHAQL